VPQPLTRTSGTTMNKPNYPPPSLAWTVWGLGALFYLIGFYQRVAPAVMTNELMKDFHIGATALGHLSAFYFYTYVAMQIPTGVLADSWGPRRLLTAGAFVAGTGSLIFAVASGFLWAGLGRMLIGGSVAVAYVGLLKVASRWFPTRRFAMVAGLALFFGVVGAVFAGVPLRMMVDAFGWRPVMLASAVFTYATGAAVWLVVRDDPVQKGYACPADISADAPRAARGGALAGVAEVLRYRNTWLLFVIPGGMVGCILAFGGLWGVPFLTTHYHMSVNQAAAITSGLMVAWAVGGPILGGLSDRIGRRKPLYVVGCGVHALCWAIVLFVPDLPAAVLVTLILIAGFATGVMIITFAYVKESVPFHLAGTVSGVGNMGVMLGPTLLQPAMGWMLDRHWQGQLVNGARIYSLTAYRWAFALMMAWALLSFVLIFFTRETRCRQMA
jgi:MFS family permease